MFQWEGNDMAKRPALSVTTYAVIALWGAGNTVIKCNNDGTESTTNIIRAFLRHVLRTGKVAASTSEGHAASPPTRRGCSGLWCLCTFFSSCKTHTIFRDWRVEALSHRVPLRLSSAHSDGSCRHAAKILDNNCCGFHSIIAAYRFSVPLHMPLYPSAGKADG